MSSGAGLPRQLNTSCSGKRPLRAMCSASTRLAAMSGAGIGTTHTGRAGQVLAQRPRVAKAPASNSGGTSPGAKRKACNSVTQPGSSAKATARPASNPRIAPLRPTPAGQRLRGSMSTSMPRKKSRAAISLSCEGVRPGNGNCPVHTEQRPHGAGEGSSSAVCRYAIKQPAPCAYWRMMPDSCWRTWASAVHLAVSCT